MKVSYKYFLSFFRDMRQNKGTILKSSVDYIRNLKRDLDKMKRVDQEKKQLEMINRKLLLRVQVSSECILPCDVPKYDQLNVFTYLYE